MQDCFLTFRGAGVMLSPLDVELLDEWSAAKVPFEVVARGIRRAAEAALFDARPGEPPLRSLRACRKQVGAEITKYRGRTTGRGGEGAAAPADHGLRTRHRKLLAALKRLAEEEPRVGPRLARWTKTAAAPTTLVEAERVEATADAMLLWSLPFDQRLCLLREARALAQNVGAISESARRVSRRFHRTALLRRALALPPFW